MHIEWKIEKKRGNLRPDLRYSVRLEEHEKALALPPVSIISTIPKPEEERQDYCYPGQYERAEKQNNSNEEYHILEVPSHKGHSWMRSLRLPWRENNEYPEVEASFHLLRSVFETELHSAYESKPIADSYNLQTSNAAKRNIAPGVLAERFLHLVNKGASVPAENTG